MRQDRILGGRVRAMGDWVGDHFLRAQPGSSCHLSEHTNCDPFETPQIVFMGEPTHIRCIRKIVASEWTPKIKFFEQQTSYVGGA